MGNCTRKTTLFDPLQRANLQNQYSRNPGETETEYLWRLSLTGRDRIVLNGNKANSYWGTGVFLITVCNPSNDSHSLTSRVAYWAGGIHVLEEDNPYKYTDTY